MGGTSKQLVAEKLTNCATLSSYIDHITALRFANVSSMLSPVHTGCPGNRRLHRSFFLSLLQSDSDGCGPGVCGEERWQWLHQSRHSLSGNRYVQNVPSTSTGRAVWPYHLLTMHDIIAHETGSFLRHYYGNRYLNSGPGNICRLSSPMTYSSSVNL